MKKFLIVSLITVTSMLITDISAANQNKQTQLDDVCPSHYGPGFIVVMRENVDLLLPYQLKKKKNIELLAYEEVSIRERQGIGEKMIFSVTKVLAFALFPGEPFYYDKKCSKQAEKRVGFVKYDIEYHNEEGRLCTARLKVKGIAYYLYDEEADDDFFNEVIETGVHFRKLKLTNVDCQ